MTRLVRSGLIVFVALILLARGAAAQQQRARELDALIDKARQDWGVVGVAVAVVKDDSVVYARGFGLREAGKPDPVDANTLFAIGSNSKAFTAAAIGLLVMEGKMGWDDPVTKHLPWFQLYDPWVTREIRIRDLLSHRSGLERGDAIWYGSSFDRKEVVRRVRYLEPSWSFRSRYGYQNIMYVAAGLALEAVAGRSWDEFVKERFFRPLGMSRSNTSIRELGGADNVASPHSPIEGRPQVIPWRNIDNVAPAGSINSSVRDMAAWLRLQLGDGVYRGQRLLSNAVIREMRTPHTITGAAMDTLFPMTHFSTYGLGFGLRDYYGRRVVQHSGGIDGMLSHVVLVPEEKLGLVILTNTDGHNLGTPLAHHILDRYLGAPPRDWNTIFLAQSRQARARADSTEASLQRSRIAGTSPSLQLEKYTGTYDNAMYGQAILALESGRLVIRRHDTFLGAMHHWHHDTFRITWERPRQEEKIMLTFVLDAAARPAALRIEGLGEFRRVDPTQAERR